MMSSQRFDPLASETDLTPVSGWQAYLREVAQHLRPYFVRRESWQRAVAYMEGLLSTVGRKNAWQLAEVNGDVTPYGIQHLLGRALWQADQLRDALYAHRRALGAPGDWLARPQGRSQSGRPGAGHAAIRHLARAQLRPRGPAKAAPSALHAGCLSDRL